MIVVGISHRRRNWELTTAPAATWTYPPQLGEVGGADRVLEALVDTPPSPVTHRAQPIVPE